MAKRARSPEQQDQHALPSIVHPLRPHDHPTKSIDFEGSIDSEDWDELVELNEEDKDRAEIDPEAEEARKEHDDWRERWEDLTAQFQPSEEDSREMLAFLKERGLLTFIKRYLVKENRSVLSLLLAFDVVLPKSFAASDFSDQTLFPILKLTLNRTLRKRAKRRDLNTFEDALELIKTSSKIIILSGAGISVSCGIPDFRSSTGLYARLKEEGKYELDDPQQMFDIHFFREQPEIFFSFASQIYPSNFVPSPSHRWIKLLEDKGKLLRNYTQNIDTLETQVGIKNVLQCHGSFATATCLRCKTTHPGSFIEPQIMSHQVPYCQACLAFERTELERRSQQRLEFKATKSKSKGKKRGKAGEGDGWGGDDSSDDDDDEDATRGFGIAPVIKPDITFFGEALDDRFDKSLFMDREEVDLLVVIGSSLQVAPVSEVLAHIPHSVPQILINKTPVKHFQPDINLLGSSDAILALISQRLGWIIPPAHSPSSSSPSSATPTNFGDPISSASVAPSLGDAPASAEPVRVGESHFWLFDGAEETPYIDAIRRAYEERDDDGDDHDEGSNRDGFAQGDIEEEGAEVEVHDSK